MSDGPLDRLLSLRQLRERQALAALARQTQVSREAALHTGGAQQAYLRYLDELEAEDASTLRYLQGARLDVDAVQQEYTRRLGITQQEAALHQAIEQARAVQVEADTQRDALAHTHSQQRKRREAMAHYHQHQTSQTRLKADLRDEDETERLTRPDWP